ncbi:AAA family ATPase [Thermaurantiacus sp.]
MPHEGHKAAWQAFEAALAAGRLHHAWLLAGPRGLGKRGFADAVAERLLGEGGGRALVRAGTHPDLRIVAPEGRTVIVVDQVRALAGFLAALPAFGAFRIVIVDAADDLNPNAANALLKMLEEPGARTLFLLVAHAPLRLLPTVRSRCRTLRFRPLGDGAVDAIVADRFPALAAADRRVLVALARGSPGEAIRLAEAEAGAILEGLKEPPAAFAQQFQGAAAAGRFEALVALAPRLAAIRARARPDQRALDAHARVSALAAEARVPGHDRMLLAYGIASALQGLHRGEA